MLKQQLKKRGCAGSQCMDGRTWAACGGSQGHLFSPRIFLGWLWLGSWLGTQFCTECWGPGWQAGSHRFRVGLPSLRKQKLARSSRPAAAAGGRAEKGGSVQTHLHPGGKCRQLQFIGDLSREAAFRSSGAAASTGTDPGEGWYLKNLLKGLLQALSE